jgi:hypothetical protein
MTIGAPASRCTQRIRLPTPRGQLDHEVLAADRARRDRAPATVRVPNGRAAEAEERRTSEVA